MTSLLSFRRYPRKRILLARAIIVFAGGLITSAVAKPDADPLLAGFREPPDSARPLVWWHWMDGNITKEGIKLDLDWMHQAGIAGFQVFDAAILTPKVVEKRLAYMTPEWKDALKYSIQLGGKYGMEMGIAGSPGWSESGGPWVPAAQGMKKYVWTEMRVDGGKPFQGKIPHPSTVTGPFQSIALPSREPGAKANFYADAAIIAYKLPEADGSEEPAPKISVSAGEIDGRKLSDGNLTETIDIPIPAAESSSWILFEYPSSQTIQSITYAANDPGSLVAAFTRVGSPAVSLQASDDGKIFRPIINLSTTGPAHHTLSFKAETARFFRVLFQATPAPPMPDWAKGSSAASFGIDPNKPAKSYKVAEIVLHRDALVNRLEEKAAFVPAASLERFPTPEANKSDIIDEGSVVDLTSHVDPEGVLTWTPPPGKWRVLRLGYSLLGITNHPATEEATGLEVDKLDHRFVEAYLRNYLDSYKEAVGADLIGRNGIANVINDSWEAGSQNWTDNMIADFRSLRGYDPVPWLPVLAGHIVKSAADSDRFLWDFRKTIADLIANEHYGQLQRTLHEYGMQHYAESHEGGRAYDVDGMQVKKFSTVPMAAMWTQLPGVNKENFNANADCRESASVAHIYGQKFVAAESMTANGIAAWNWAPNTLKPTADAELLAGINRFVIHESTHQPLVNKAPGLTLGPYGQWFNRNETWAPMARPWVDYLSRSSYLLQQGTFAADVVYFYGEDTNLTAIFGNHAPAIPQGYNFDYINADGLINELRFKDDAITAGSGMKYRLLALDPGAKSMSLPVLKAIFNLVSAGANMVGEKPTFDPSLADDQREFQRIADELFPASSGVCVVGRGKVFPGGAISAALQELKIAPDFSATGSDATASVKFVHRSTDEAEIYFVDSRTDSPHSFKAQFRITDKVPELWDAESGKTEPVSYRVKDGVTEIPLNLPAWGTTFVVFRGQLKTSVLKTAAYQQLTEHTIEGPWILTFQADRGAPDSIKLDRLLDWSSSADPGVKYFSGIGRYRVTIQVPKEWIGADRKTFIDLGEVKNLAAIYLNGRKLGTVWHAPYKLDVTGSLKEGPNVLEVEVANAWVNRFIGDEQPGAARIAFADIKPYSAETKPVPSGLLGPVKVVVESVSKE